MKNGRYRAYRLRRQETVDFRISRNGFRWEKIDVTRISADGLAFQSPARHDIHENLQLSLRIYGTLSEFTFQLSGVIVSRVMGSGTSVYFVRFTDITLLQQVHLEEIFNSQRDEFEPESDSEPVPDDRFLL